MTPSSYEADFVHLDEVLSLAAEAAHKPEIYFEAPKTKREDLKKGIKRVYDLAFGRRLTRSSKSQVLPELIVDGFDNEQIWQQIESANDEIFGRQNMEKVARAMTQKSDSSFPFQVDHSEDDEDEDEEEDQESNLESEGEFMSEDEDDEASEKRVVASQPKKKRRKTEVDDMFFKLDELDEYLKREDRREMSDSKKKDDESNDDDDDDDNESIDLFKDIPDSDEEEDEENQEEEENTKSVKYADFFDAPESDAEGENNKEEYDKNGDEDDEYFEEEGGDEQMEPEPVKDKKQVKFDLLGNTDSEDSEADQGNKNQVKSGLKIREDRLKKKIQELEAKAMSAKPWNQKGEVDSSSRPPNSALEEILDFTSVTRPAPVMTEKTSMKLEDIIRTRIKDKAWDDVERKFKPVETPLEYKKKLVLNMEKSKESLAQIYENEYLKQREKVTGEDGEEKEEEEAKEHTEIKKGVRELFRKLDALSNYHYTPKPAKPEIKIVSNIPAINMEEVAPVATSDATLLAPEEIKAKQKGELIGKSERTKTDMKRERRKKKLKQHIRALNQSKKLTDDTRQKKSVKNKFDSKKLTGRNIIKTDEVSARDGKSLKSSTAFFAQLQDQVESSIKNKTKGGKTNSKKSKNSKSAVKLKL